MNILITGSASGLGYNAGINLAREGYHVFLTTENDKQLEVLNDKVKNMDNIDTFKLDVTNKNDLKKLDELEALGPLIDQKFGRLDVLIANAGILGGLTPIAHSKMILFLSIPHLTAAS